MLTERPRNRQSIPVVDVKWSGDSGSSDHSLVLNLSSPHQITWLRVDEDVPPHAVVTGSNLYIENLNKSYNGTYRCVASNTVGEAYDDYILYVHGRCRASMGRPLLQSEFKKCVLRRCRWPVRFVVFVLIC